MATMSMGMFRERELMMVSRTSSRVEVLGAWSEFAMVGVVSLMMTWALW